MAATVADEELSLTTMSGGDLEAILGYQLSDSQMTIASVDINVLKAELQRRQSGGGLESLPPTLFAIKPESGTVRRAEPTVEIIEEPRARGLRFRYKCEGRSAGSLPGERSTNEHKTFPTIRINNFPGPAAIVVVSCVTKDKPYCPHPHNLVGQDCRDGVCTVKVKGRTTVQFPNIGIQCCKRHDVEESLKLREKIRVDPYGTGYFRNTNNIDLNSVRLCFQVFLPDANKKFTHIVPPVVSQPIIDKKSVHDLVICRLSRQSGYAGGGDEVFLLCEKINKDDIQVRFYEETEDGLSWEAFGDFASHDVHRQYAIVFRTPPYRDPHIQQSVQVFIQLRRPSDDEFGDPKPFQYIPQDPDPYGITNKRKRKEVNLESFYSDRIPLSVWSEVKEDAESMSTDDVKSRLKKKAVSGLQRKDSIKAAAAAAASSAAVTEQILSQLGLSVQTTSTASAVRQGASIVLSAEALSSLLSSTGVTFSTGTPVASHELVQYLVDQSQNSGPITLSLDAIGSSVNTTPASEQVLNDLNVGAQEMVLEEETSSVSQHPLHSS